jgi:hypothetical protein
MELRHNCGDMDDAFDVERDRRLKTKRTELEARGAGGNTGPTNLNQFPWRQ